MIEAWKKQNYQARFLPWLRGALGNNSGSGSLAEGDDMLLPIDVWVVLGEPRFAKNGINP